MTALPTDAEVRARAEELGLLAPGADLSRAVSRQVSKLLFDEASQPPPPVAPAAVLLSRITQRAVGGVLQVDVSFLPDPQPKGSPNV